MQRDTGLPAQRLRASCAITWETGALLDAFACALAPGQDAAPTAFTRADLGVLYGSRGPGFREQRQLRRRPRPGDRRRCVR